MSDTYRHARQRVTKEITLGDMPEAGETFYTAQDRSVGLVVDIEAKFLTGTFIHPAIAHGVEHQVIPETGETFRRRQ